jgi:hypothetical protein
MYPYYNWLPWKFPEFPVEYWDDLKNQRKFMDWAARQLNIDDWYKVSIKVLTSEFQVEYIGFG